MTDTGEAPRVEIHPAYVWECPDCRCENFVRPIHYVPETAEDIAQVREFLGLDEWQPIPDGELHMAPKEAPCAYCGKTWPLFEGAAADE